ncbi:MAG TPA: ATP-binding protein [Candidatus Wunengus sp. YC60]|uniref:ATP-binding protein n=1 Tax=Candidatus Wunengus sp. YC60 TaxID=3367697 RepID=UPI00402A09EF
MAKNTEVHTIEVSARLLRHISRGIYRTPAGALKELVSNAYDAGADKVTINSGYPIFEKIVIKDNGSGMSKKVFIKIIKRIGLSDKVAGTEFRMPGSKGNRVMVGHYGIGLLAIGQLCKKVIITSKTEKSTEGFEATIDFEQFEVKETEGIKRSRIKDEKSLEQEDKTANDQKLPIGKCVIKNLKYDKKHQDECFTKLDLMEVRDVVQKKLSGDRLKEYRDLSSEHKYSANLKDILTLFRDKEEEIKRGQYPYEKLCWELATYCPLKYSDIKICEGGQPLNFFKKLTEKHNFTLILDGMEIYNPLESIFLDKKDSSWKDIFVWKEEEYSKGKKVSGYLIFKQKIRPKCMQGILVRVSGVAVGMHDLTYLEYPYHEATKLEQLTGELFVEGLSGAMNIDRSSFNETDDSYLDFVKWFHDKLHDKVFPRIKKEMRKKRKEDVIKLFDDLVVGFYHNLHKKYKISLIPMGKDVTLFHKQDKMLQINTKHPEGRIKKSTMEKLLLAAVLVANNLIEAERMEQILSEINKSKEGLKENARD